MGTVGRKLKIALLAILILFILGTSLMPDIALADSDQSVTILFTHDMHDNLLPFKTEKDGSVVYSGGYARLQTAILDEKKAHPDAILVDAGDFSMGTPFQTIFASDAPELRILGMMGYDAVTFGNHEFDYRATGLAKSLEAAKNGGDRLPPIVQSNTTFPTNENGNLTASLKDLQKAYEDYGIKESILIEKNGVKIGIFGLMGEDAASKAPMSEVQFTKPVENAQRIVKSLKEQGAELIVCLSHTGTWANKSDSEDEILARKVPEIDVIISGHTHTKLAEPIIIGKTIIGSVEDYGKNLGVLNLTPDSNHRWKLGSYDLKPIGEELAEDKSVAGRIGEFKELVQKEYFDRFGLQFDEVLAKTPFSFKSTNDIIKIHQEEPLGNLISDAYIYAAKKAEGAGYIPIDAAIVPIGTIRSSFLKGDITAADVFCTSSLGIGADQIPGYPLISVYLTGKELKTVCEVDASVSPIMEDAQLFMSGLNFTFNPRRLIFNKVTDTALEKPDGSKETIDDNKLYRVAAGLYSAQMLSVVGDKSAGLLSIVPKTSDGVPITDFEAQIIRNKADGNSELKEWQAIAEYLQSFDKVGGVPQIPDYYAASHGRKVVDNSTNIAALLSRPNKIAAILYAVIAVVLLLAVFIIRKIALRSKRKRMKKIKK